MVRYEKLERLMAARGINRSQLASELKISSRTMAKISKGLKLSPIVLNKISSYFGCKPDDLYDEFDDMPVIDVPNPELANTFSSANALYVIDSEHRVVEFNRPMSITYPNLKKGDICYKSIMNTDTPCESCPLTMDSDEDMTFYNSVIGQWVSIRRSEVYYPGSGICGVLACRRTGDMLKEINNRLPSLSSYDVYIEMNLTKNNYRIILPNDPAPEKNFSHDRLDHLIQRTADNLVHPNDRDAFLEFWDISTLVERINGPEHKIHGVFRECRKSGVWDTIYITIVPEKYYGTSDVMIMALYMIIPGRAAETHDSPRTDEVYIGNHKLNFDYMTGLPLRRSFWDYVDKSPISRSFGSNKFCVLATDIEHFHVINNWYGRAAGDSLLSKIGEYLKSIQSESDVISGYMGGDNFCTVFKYNKDKLYEIVHGITDIVASFKDEASFNPIFGACIVDFAETSTIEAYDRCIMAIKRGDQNGKNNICWYDAQMIKEQQAEERLILQFEKGLENGEISFYLQPKCDIKTGKIVGAEALSRWISPEFGFISPGTFVPVLENAGKVTKLDYYIWENVCQTISRWRAEGLPTLPISVNVSRLDVFSMDLVHNFTKLVQKYGLRPSDIEIEITESAYVENDSIIKEVQSGLRMAGFSTLIDDFGSGYSSLNFLKDVDTDAIKLDFRFLETTDSANIEKGTNILSSVLSLAEKLNMVAIAEGVETEEQVNLLLRKGCPLAQGYYFYKPMPVSEFEELISDPDNISEGMRLSDFCPEPKQNDDFEMKTFSGFDDKLEAFMRTLMDVASLVRIVDTRNYKEYRLDDNGKLTSRESHCYDIWGRKKECKDCISVIAVENRKVTSKYEVLNRDTFYIIAKPISIAGEIYSMETAIKIM